MKSTPESSTQEVLAGLVERVTFHNAENGFCVLRAKARGHRDLVTVVGHAAVISAGEWITATGEWINDRAHGQQFKARFLKTSAPSSIDGIAKYLGSGLIRGIGPVYAKKMVKAFGDKVFDVIEAEPDRLREVTGIGVVRAKRITDAWAEQKIVREIMVFLHGHGVGTARAVRIFKTYGADAVRHSGGVGGVSPPPAQRSDEAASLSDLIAGLADLDANGLRLQWRNHLGGTPPAHLPRWLLLKILAYQIQAATLGGLDKATLRVIRQPKGQTPDSSESRLFEPRIPTTREGADLRAGAILAREWKGKLERVMVLEKGFAWNGKSYASLSQIAVAMTGTSWNGHRFFGLRTVKSERAAQAARRAVVCDASAGPEVSADEPTATRHAGNRRSLPAPTNAPTAVAYDGALRHDTGVTAP